MFACVKLNYVMLHKWSSKVLLSKPMCPNYPPEFRNIKSHLLQRQSKNMSGLMGRIG